MTVALTPAERDRLRTIIRINGWAHAALRGLSNMRQVHMGVAPKPPRGEHGAEPVQETND